MHIIKWPNPKAYENISGYMRLFTISTDEEAPFVTDPTCANSTLVLTITEKGHMIVPDWYNRI